MKRFPRGFDPDHEFALDLKRKDFVATMKLTEEQICDARFHDYLSKAIAAAAPFMEFLTRASGFPWREEDPRKAVDPLRLAKGKGSL